MANPWDLDTALGSPSGSQPASVQPGDTIWLLPGTYVPSTSDGFYSHVNGTASAPVIVRNYQGGRVTLDGGTGFAALTANGSYGWFWGLELMSSCTTRTTGTSGSGGEVCAYGFVDLGPGNKLINSIVHDTSQGISGFNASSNAEYNGNLVYYNGWIGTDRNHGHGLYLQNITGTKSAQDNISANNADEGTQIYGSGGASLIGITFTGNTLFNNSSWPYQNYQFNFLLGGGQTDSGNSITNNFTYFPPSADQGYVAVGTYTPGDHITVTGNVFVGGYQTLLVQDVAGPYTFTGNSLVADPNALQIVNLAPAAGQTLSTYSWNNNAYYGLNGFFGGQYDPSSNDECCGSTTPFPAWQSGTGFDSASTFSSSMPTGQWIYVRPNTYESKRANVIVYNWNLSPAASVDVSGVLAPGDKYQVLDSQNFFGAPVASGTYQGGAISIPMNTTAIAPIIGASTPPHTSAQFGAFILLVPGAAANSVPVSTSPAPAPTPSPAPSSGFVVGETVQVLPDLGPQGLNIRASANTALTPLGTEAQGGYGVIAAGPTTDPYGNVMWDVNFYDGQAGWVVGWYLQAAPNAPNPPASTSAPAPTPSPVPTGTPSSISNANWKVVYVDSQETQCENGAAQNAVDGNPATIWHTQYCSTVSPLPHEIQIDLGSAYTISGFGYLPRQDGGVNGRIGQYEFYATNNTSNWGSPIVTGTFANDATQKQVLFLPGSYRYVRLRALTEANGGPWTSMAELSVLQAAGSSAALSSIAITPGNSTVAVGASQQLTATGTLQNGSTADVTAQVTWSSSSSSVMVSPSGIATGQAVGSATISATQGNLSSSAIVTVSSNSSISLAALPKTAWALLYADSQETQCENGAAVNAFDGNSATIWHTQYCSSVAQLPHEIQVDMEASYTITGFRYLPRQDGGVNGRIGQYEFYATNDPSNWGSPLATGTFTNDATEKQVLFAPNSYRYLRLRALTEANGGPWTSMAELTALSPTTNGQ